MIRYKYKIDLKLNLTCKITDQKFDMKPINICYKNTKKNFFVTNKEIFRLNINVHL